jgi:predicted ArsR family transcriptional regulator
MTGDGSTPAVERVVGDLHEQTTSARLVYLALRDRGGDSATELAERLGLNSVTVYNALEDLETAGWVSGDVQPEDARGRHPRRYKALVVCPDCGDRFLVNGLSAHRSYCDDDRLTASDLREMDPEEAGLDEGDVSEPGGVR